MHHGTEEGFYVVSGRYRFRVGGETIDCTAGSHVTVRPGTAHTFWNAGDVHAVALIILTPPAFASYFRELANGLAAAHDGDPWVDVRRSLSSRFDIEVVEG